MYTWTCANNYGVDWSYVFTTGDKSKVAKYIKNNVEVFWPTYFSECVELIEQFICDKIENDESGSGSDIKEYSSRGPLFKLLEEFIGSRLAKKKKISQEAYVEKITEFLADMRSDDIIKSMEFWEETGNKEDRVFSLKKNDKTKIIKV